MDETGKMLRVRAIAGTHVVVLAWDTLDGKKPAQELLGFAIEREELDAQGAVVERYWLQGIKRFRFKDIGLPDGTPVSFAEHPLQSFQWGDYTPEPNRRYRYRIVPVTGKPKLLKLENDLASTIEVTTEPLAADGKQGTRHDIYFNRGVIGSQAYARRFHNQAPDADDPQSDKMVWLSRGLYEALRTFIGRALDKDWGLRAAVYEFHYQPVVNAFATAVEKGADVKIVYDAESSYKDDNLASIRSASLDRPDVAIARTVSEGIRHNKFIVLLHKDKPVAVWTGSTNISDGGIFGHSNVGHVVWDEAIAKKYLEYWGRLAEKGTTPSKLRVPNTDATPLPVGKPPDGITPVFSPRDPKGDTSTTLQWYADRMAEANQLVCFTVAFNLDEVFQKVIKKNNDVLRYIVKDDDLDKTETVGSDHDVLFAAGGRLDKGALANFKGERDNPLNQNDYIHTKFMLVDPLSEDPLVVTGSANFSVPSQTQNDENMLVIRGDKRVAHIYFGEYMRVFDHHYARYLVKKLKNKVPDNPNAGYLKETADEWLPSQWDNKSHKPKRRKYFVGR